MPEERNTSCCAPSRGPVSAPAAAGRSRVGSQDRSTKNMVALDGGAFLMGTDDASAVPGDGEGPVREVEVDPFLLDSTTVTNTQFAVFVKQTGYVTAAERFGWSFVFYQLIPPRIAATVTDRVTAAPWWCKVDGASWRSPEGPGTDITSRQNHPVVHVAWEDAEAYAAWAHKRLPTEAEWESAARGGLVQARYPWGDELRPRGAWRCNIWQGSFPERNTLEDGHLGTAQVKAYKPNAYGLHNMVGNVWEWISDWFSPDWHVHHPATRNPAGPPTGTDKVMRGGSFLCHDSYCNRYRVAARHRSTPDSSSSNVGFRCAADPV